jgi:hypothetical protein
MWRPQGCEGGSNNQVSDLRTPPTGMYRDLGSLGILGPYGRDLYPCWGGVGGPQVCCYRRHRTENVACFWEAWLNLPERPTNRQLHSLVGMANVHADRFLSSLYNAAEAPQTIGAAKQAHPHILGMWRGFSRTPAHDFFSSMMLRIPVWCCWCARSC